MALSKVNYNSMNVTPAASKAIKFNSSNNGLETGDLSGNLILLELKTTVLLAVGVKFKLLKLTLESAMGYSFGLSSLIFLILAFHASISL